MTLYKNKYRIETPLLKKWDYSRDGYYFTTICVKNHKCLFGYIKYDKVILSSLGEIADKYWHEIPDHFPFVKLDEFIIMPNHIHGILVINRDRDRRDKALPCLYMDMDTDVNNHGDDDNINDKNNNDDIKKINTESRFQNQGKGTNS